MTTYTTITGRQIKVSSNQSKRTFTIKTESGKYRTISFTREDFNRADRFWTGNDWQNFLKTDEYFKVK